MPGRQRERAVGDALRRLREEAQHTVKDVAAALGWSGSKLSRIETGHSGIKPDDAQRLMDHYRADQHARDEIERLWNEHARDGEVAVALPPVYERFVELEARASRISIYHPMIVPGLLQIPEYAAEVIHATPENEDHLVEARLNLRMTRQAIFASSVVLEVIIDESVLLRPIGGREIMRLQMRRLQEIIERQDKSILVVPLSVGAHPGIAGPFIILDFSHDEESRVFCDGLTGGVLRSSPDEVSRYRACFVKLKELALSAEESAAKFEISSDFVA